MLDKSEAYHTLKAVMPVDADGKWLSENFDKLWTVWDENDDGVVSMSTPGEGRSRGAFFHED